MKMKIIGVVTSGGDAPGMNAAIRGVVRIANSKNMEVIGFERGWEGLLTNSFRRLVHAPLAEYYIWEEQSFIRQDA